MESMDRLPRPFPVWLIVGWRLFTALFPAALASAFLFGADDVVGTSLGIVCLLFTGWFVLAAYGMWALRPWGRVLEILSAIPWLLAFPIGTLASVLTFIFLSKKETKLLYSGRRPGDLTEDERRVLEEAAADRPGAGCWVVAALGAVGGLFFAGIVAAIAIPNLINAIDRGKQKRTMADLRSIGTAIEEYAIDHNEYPSAPDMAALRGHLEREYLLTWPAVDGWEHPFEGYSDPDHYVLCSPGKDGGDCTWENDDEGGPTTSFNSSIFFGNGEFMQYPEGIQR